MSTDKSFINLQQLNKQLPDNNLQSVLNYNSYTSVQNRNKKMDVSRHFGCYFDTETKKYFKIYNKNIIWRRSGAHGAEKTGPVYPYEARQEHEKLYYEQYKSKSIKKSEYDVANWMVDLLKSKKFDLLPDVAIDTKDYIGIEWYTDGWRPLQSSDLIIEVLGISVVNKRLRGIIKQFYNIQSECLLDETDTELMDMLYDDYITMINPCLKIMCADKRSTYTDQFKKNYKPCVGVSGLSSDDFLISMDGKKCKYVDLDNFHILPQLNNTMWVESDNDDDSFGHPAYSISDNVSILKAIYNGKTIRAGTAN